MTWAQRAEAGHLAVLGDAHNDSFRHRCAMASHPFEAICTPIHNSTNATTRSIPWMVVGAIFCVILEAYT